MRPAKEAHIDGDSIYRKNISELDLTALADLCGNVAHNLSSKHAQSDEAHRLRMEWVRMKLEHGTETEQESLRKRMAEFLAGVPRWITSGIR